MENACTRGFVKCTNHSADKDFHSFYGWQILKTVVLFSLKLVIKGKPE